MSSGGFFGAAGRAGTLHIHTLNKRGKKRIEELPSAQINLIHCFLCSSPFADEYDDDVLEDMGDELSAGLMRGGGQFASQLN